MTGVACEAGGAGAGPKTMQLMMKSLKIPKTVYFSAALLIESRVRLSVSPKKGKTRFIHNRDFLDALDYNRIVLRAEKQREDILNEWSDLYEQKGNKRKRYLKNCCPSSSGGRRTASRRSCCWRSSPR